MCVYIYIYIRVVQNKFFLNIHVLPLYYVTSIIKTMCAKFWCSNSSFIGSSIKLKFSLLCNSNVKQESA